MVKKKGKIKKKRKKKEAKISFCIQLSSYISTQITNNTISNFSKLLKLPMQDWMPICYCHLHVCYALDADCTCFCESYDVWDSCCCL